MVTAVFSSAKGFTPPALNCGGISTEANGINDDDDIVGECNDGTEHGFLLRDGVYNLINYPGSDRNHRSRDQQRRGYRRSLTIRRCNVKPRGNGLLRSLLLLALCCAACTQKESATAPQTASAGKQAAQIKADRSRILKLRGVLKDYEGKRVSGVVGVLFAIYEQQEGGSPLWQEVQNVEVDDRGRFTASVGATKSEGILPELFTAQKTRWLGEQVLLPGEVEQSRIRIVSTSDGLVAQRAVRLVIPEESGDQPATAEAQPASEQAADSPKDESAKGPSGSRLRFRRRRLMP